MNLSYGVGDERLLFSEKCMHNYSPSPYTYRVSDQMKTVHCLHFDRWSPCPPIHSRSRKMSALVTNGLKTAITPLTWPTEFRFKSSGNEDCVRSSSRRKPYAVFVWVAGSSGLQNDSRGQSSCGILEGICSGYDDLTLKLA